jgi:hypothetical protein
VTTTRKQPRIEFLPIIVPLAPGTTNALRGCLEIVDDMA